MVFVDFSNPYLREYFPKWLKKHKARLERVQNSLASWAEKSYLAEEIESIKEGRKARPLAIVLDIDEVLLCNTHLNGFAAPPGVQGPNLIDFHIADFFADRETGKPWGRTDTGDPALPGALELLETIIKLGITPFFVTGRLECIRAITIADFCRAGFVQPHMLEVSKDLESGPNTLLLMCPDSEAPPPGTSTRRFKEECRAQIEKSKRIIANIGDQISDLGLYGDQQVYMPHPFYYTP